MKKICTALILLMSFTLSADWSIFTGYNLGTEIKSKYSGSTELLDKTTAPFLIGLEYKNKIQAINYAVGLEYTMDRTINELVYAGTTIPYGTPNKISFASFYGNIYIPTIQNLNLIIGINRPFLITYLMTTGTSFDLNALNIGYQFGFEYFYSQNLSLQALFSINNFTRELAPLGKTEYYSISGVEIQAKYTF